MFDIKQAPSCKVLLMAYAFAMLSVFASAMGYFNEVWMDDGTYSHGYLNLLIIGFVIYSERTRLSTLNITFNFNYVISFIVCLVAGYSMSYFELEFIYRCFFFLAVVSAIKSLTANDQFKLFIVPLLLLLFALPVWGLTIPLLQNMAVLIVSNIVSLSGTEVLVEDILITLPNGAFKVADGCSGLRYLLVGGTLASFYWYMYFNKTSSFFKLLTFITVLSLITNWVRILYLVYVGHTSNMTDPLMDDHNMLGWYIFIAPVVMTFVYGRYLELQERRQNGC